MASVLVEFEVFDIFPRSHSACSINLIRFLLGAISSRMDAGGGVSSQWYASIIVGCTS